MSRRTVLVTSETHFVRGSDGVVRSTAGVDGYGFWARYLDAFDEVLVAARTGTRESATNGVPVEGPHVRVCALPDYRGPWEYLRTRHLLRQALGNAVASADALCLRAPGPIAGATWRLRGARPVALEVVGDPYDSLAPGGVRGVARPIARKRLVQELRDMAREATAVGYVTEATLQRRYPAGGWSTSYSSIDLGDAAFVGDEHIASRSYAGCGTPAHPWRLVFVGSLAQLYKAPDVLIDAVAFGVRHGFELALTMIGDGVYRERLVRQARERGIGERVRFAGQVAAAAVRPALDAAHLFVLPSRTEGLPRAMIEAMARGVPALGANVGGIPELLPPDRLVPPGDATALAEAIESLCSDPIGLRSHAVRDLAVARRYHATVLRARRRALYERLREAIGAAVTRAAAGAP
jgi:phosphatidylinositol alpha-1,6-mannosyltransferase